MNRKPMIRDGLITIGVLSIFFAIAYYIQRVLHSETLIPAVLILGVFMISVLTSGYRYGIVASIISVLEQNFAFTFPYFKINFSLLENVITAIITVIIALLTCSLTIKLKHSEVIKAEGEKEKMRANLMRAISHDLRTPLTTIYGASSMLLENYEELSEEQKSLMLTGIKEDSQWLTNMVENILSITRIDDGKVKIIKTPTVVEELIDSVLVKLKKVYKTQTVAVSLPNDVLLVDMDAILIEQVLLNLLENAVQHAIGMEKLELKVEEWNTRVVFSVTDDGCGIAKERLKDIFLGYNIKTESDADTKRKNAGIGLSVCATIVHSHGGEIYVRNNEKKGATFSFWLERGENIDAE